MKFTKEQLLQKINAKNIDINKSANFMGTFGLADKFGTRESFVSAEVFISKLQTLCDIDLSVFTYDEPYWVEGTLESPKETSAELKEEVEVIAPVSEEKLLESTETLISLESVVEDKEDKPEVDWDWVDSLEDSPENRLVLDEYAEKFDINLKRTMKTSNMAKKFKEALA